jgi:hypothetical protein
MLVITGHGAQQVRNVLKLAFRKPPFTGQESKIHKLLVRTSASDSSYFKPFSSNDVSLICPMSFPSYLSHTQFNKKPPDTSCKFNQ